MTRETDKESLVTSKLTPQFECSQIHDNINCNLDSLKRKIIKLHKRIKALENQSSVQIRVEKENIIENQMRKKFEEEKKKEEHLSEISRFNDLSEDS